MKDESPRGYVIYSIYPARTGTNFPYFQLGRRSFRFPSQLISQCNFSQLAQILHEERVFCRAALLGTPENNRRLHIVQKITKNLTTLNNLPNSIHKLQIKPYRENEKSDIRLMNLPFTSAVKNTTQTQSSTNWNLTLKSPKFTVFKERYFGPPFNFAHEITHETPFF